MIKQIRRMEANEGALEAFAPTKEVGEFLKINEKEKTWYVQVVQLALSEL